MKVMVETRHKGVSVIISAQRKDKMGLPGSPQMAPHAGNAGVLHSEGRRAAQEEVASLSKLQKDSS